MTQTQGKGVVKEFEFHPTIFIRPEALQKLDFYIEAATGEISGFGTVTQLNELEFLIEDVYIFEQESSGGGTEIDGDTLAQGIIELLNTGIDPASMRLWWHSHANMGTFFSGTDTDTMDNTLTDAPWMISIVGNKAGSYRVRFDLHRPIRMWADAQTLYIFEEEGADKFCEARSCVKLVDHVASKKYCTEHEALRDAIFAEEKEKNKPPVTRAATVVYQGKGLESRGEKGRSGSLDGKWSWGYDWDDYPEGGYFSYRDTKFCDATSCYTRVERETKYCEKHNKEYTEFAEYLRKLQEDGKEMPKEAIDLGGEYELCDVIGCSQFLEIITSYYKGLVLCDKHLEDLFQLEFMFGEFENVDSPKVIMAILEYYLDRQDAIDDGDTVAEENLLDLIEASNVKLSAPGIIQESLDTEKSEKEPEPNQTADA